MATALQKAQIIQLTGLGYSRTEIARQLSLTEGQVRYWSRKIEKQARKNGPNTTYTQIMLAGLTPEIIKTLELIQKIK